MLPAKRTTLACYPNESCKAVSTCNLCTVGVTRCSGAYCRCPSGSAPSWDPSCGSSAIHQRCWGQNASLEAPGNPERNQRAGKQSSRQDIPTVNTCCRPDLVTANVQYCCICSCAYAHVMHRSGPQDHDFTHKHVQNIVLGSESSSAHH